MTPSSSAGGSVLRGLADLGCPAVSWPSSQGWSVERTELSPSWRCPIGGFLVASLVGFGWRQARSAGRLLKALSARSLPSPGSSRPLGYNSGQMAAVAFIAFLGGLIVGSFDTAVAHRVPRGISISGPRSECPACGAQIAAYDNVPLLSWILLHGRARCCGAHISLRYPMTELAVGALFALTVLVHWHDSPAAIAIDLVFVTMLAAITLTDIERRIIPNKILITGAVLCVLLAIPSDPGGMAERAIAAAAAGGLFFLVVLAYPAGMGIGDVKLAAVMGLFLGEAVAPSILIALLAGSIVGLALIARHGARARKMAIPFGPFLALGGVVGMLAGSQLINIYLG
jgi:leader peptidase (prepilin peptidase) / N-methyltransferase